MTQTYGYIKVTLVALLIAIISYLHYGAIGAHLGLHIIHRELYFIPIILSCFWFGSAIGVSTAIIVSIVYAPHIYLFEDTHGASSAVITQVAVFIAVAISIGFLIDRQRKKQTEMMALENLEVLGRAASVVEYEISTTLNVLRKAFPGHSVTHTEGEMEDYRREIDRLAQMAEALRAFVPKQDNLSVIHDLNTTVLQRIEMLKPQARKHNLYLRVELDPSECPSKIQPERFGPILSYLIKNAIEVSEPGQTIRIGSERGGDFCKVFVEDHGQGIRPEHLPKIFSPFFTTKPDGHGLALAASRKYLVELGGDITVQSEFGKGAIFTLYLPREEAATIINDISKRS